MSIDKKIKHFEAACREAGLKITHQRMEVFRELATSHDHPSVETIYKRLLKKLPTISLDTVYRTLNTLEKQGMVSRVDTTESQARFEAEMSPHHHIICNKCGTITDFQSSDLDESVILEKVQDWGVVKRMNITLYGLCKGCSK